MNSLAIKDFKETAPVFVQKWGTEACAWWSRKQKDKVREYPAWNRLKDIDTLPGKCADCGGAMESGLGEGVCA